MALQHELGHKHPFASKEHEALLSVYLPPTASSAAPPASFATTS